MFKELRQLIYDSVSFDLVEILWAKLPSYKITPQGMVQMYVNQNIPNEILIQIFAENIIK